MSFLWAASALADRSAEDRATALVHTPALMIDWARSLVGLGKLVEAKERYEQIIREGVDANAVRRSVVISRRSGANRTR